MSSINCKLVTSRIPLLVLSIIASFSKALENYHSFLRCRKAFVFSLWKKPEQKNELIYIAKNFLKYDMLKKNLQELPLKKLNKSCFLS
jgi:uncharacterized FlgJ-related protein